MCSTKADPLAVGVSGEAFEPQAAKNLIEGESFQLMANRENIKSVIESIMFVLGEPLEVKVAADLFNLTSSEMTEIFRELAADYQERESGLAIVEGGKSFQLTTNPRNDDYIRLLCTPVKEKRLTQAALETLAVIAYKQPVSKPEIDSIRGIKSDRVLEGLVKKGLVEILGRSTAIGRPILYGTTENFLFQFGLESLQDLPKIEDIGNLILAESEIYVSADVDDNQIKIELPAEEEIL